MTRDLFDIPELVYPIAAYLDSQDLFNCVQVSKAWASHFVPLLWRSFRLGHRSPNQSREAGEEIDAWDCFANAGSSGHKTRMCHQSANIAFAKNGHYTRELTVENPGALLFFGSHFSHLNKLICRFSDSYKGHFTRDRDEILNRVWELVVKSPHLNTLRLGVAEHEHGRFQRIPWPFYPNNKAVTAQHLLHLQSLPMLQHLSVSMGEVEYFEFCTRFPRLVEARFRLQSVQSILHPYHPQKERDINNHNHNNNSSSNVNNTDGSNNDDERVGPNVKAVQCSLKQLVLEIAFGRFDPQLVQMVFRRFPRLERLKILSNPLKKYILVDLSSDRQAWASFDDIYPEEYQDVPSGPLLALDGSFWYDNEVAEIIGLLPVPLKRMHWKRIGERAIDALATHCSETLEVVTGGVLYRSSDDYDVPLERMSKTVGVLLARCPKLRIVDSPKLMLHIRYLMDHPWACCDHLEQLRCTVVGIPKMSAEEKSLVQVVLDRQEQQPQGENHHTKEERRVLEKRDLIDRCLKALQGHLEKCPNLVHNFHDLLVR
ncbi:hypothetical protein DFQ26_007593 [Actinomortierella ambigua]|nr:hypothetical protein DFQ26_007593 [Actinomortierella ambigua]